MKGIDKILKEFYKHATGTDDYGCKYCIKAKQQLLTYLLKKMPKKIVGSFSKLEGANILGYNRAIQKIIDILKMELK